MNTLAHIKFVLSLTIKVEVLTLMKFVQTSFDILQLCL
jgi:hypothetical protein